MVMKVKAAVGSKRAFAYRRVSTAEQAGEKHNSLPEQEARTLAYCAARGWSVVGAFTDVGSGKKDDRRQYRRMVESALAGDADVVVVQFLDRFGRNPREILRRVWELQESGVSVEASDEDIREELMLLVKAGVAGQESRRNAERVRGYMRAAAKQGMKIGRPPYGYRRRRVVEGDTVRSVFEQDPAEAAAVREMYRLVVDENVGGKAVADYLNKIGAPARAGTWSSDSVRRILDNPALAGRMVWSRADCPERIDNFYPAILSADEWERLSERRALRAALPNRALGSEWLLTGILRCGHCGGAMQGRSSTPSRSGKKYRSYRCMSATRARDLCQTLNGHSAPLLERSVLEALSRYTDPDVVANMVADEQAQSATTETADERKRLERELKALNDDFAQNLALLKKGVLDEADFTRANASRRTDRAALEKRIGELAMQQQRASQREKLIAELPKRVAGFVEAFESMDPHAAKGLLQTLLQAVHVWKDRRVEIEFRL